MLGKSCWVCGFMVYGLLIYSYPAARWQKHPHLKSPFPPKKSFPSQLMLPFWRTESIYSIWEYYYYSMALKTESEDHTAIPQLFGESQLKRWFQNLHSQPADHLYIWDKTQGGEHTHTHMHTCVCTLTHLPVSKVISRHFWALWPWTRHSTSLCSIPSSSWMWELTEL